jgi:DNA polymerase/3'-5' exonuclease PolX
MDKDKGERLNERLAGLMSELSQAMSKKGEVHRARAYAKAEEVILSITDDITSLEQLKGRPGIGATIMEKMKEYMESGKVGALEREQAKPETVLSDVYGVGPKKAVELVGKGITSIAELRARQEEVLNDVQKIGLKYYEDILEKIPREEIDRYNAVFGKVLEEAMEKGEGSGSARYEIVGSYRRGAAKSGDIDVILTAEKGEIFTRFVDGLIQRKVVIEVLSRGKSKCLAIARLQGVSGAKARRVDFLFSSPEEYPFAILYFTGSKAFNTVMRGHALRVGYTLNEHGLSKVVDNKKEEKVVGNFGEEKDIFAFLGLEYKRPSERLDGRAVVALGTIPEKPATKIPGKIAKMAKSSPKTQKMKLLSVVYKKTLWMIIILSR